MNSMDSPNFSPTMSLKSCSDQLTDVRTFDDPAKTIGLVVEVKKSLETYASYVFSNDLEPQIREDLLKEIQERLSVVSFEIENAKFSIVDSETLFQELSECHELLSTLLLNHTARKGWIESTVELFQNSRATQEIKWKIKKYESLILALSKAMKSIDGDPAKTLVSAIQLPEFYQVMVDANNAKRFTLENLNLIRNIYSTDFMNQLRKQLQKHPAEPGLLEICHQLYSNISLDKHNQNVLQLFEKWGENCLKEQSLTSQFTHPEVMEFDYLDQKIRAAPQSAKAPYMAICANSMRGVFNRAFDPSVQGNPIHCLYAVKIGDKEIKSLGFGSPTTEGLTFYNSAALTPEFLGFLNACKKKEKRHLFIMNQDITSNGYIAAEKQRCDLVMNLQSDRDYKGTFFAVALSKNSTFYCQESKDYSDTRDFIDDLISQFQHPYSGSMISEEIMNLTELNLKHIADAIHRYLFDSKVSLEKNERLIFIEVFYDQIIKWLMLKLRIDTYNISCKDAVDRGAASNAQLYSHLAIINDMFTEEHMQRTQVLMIVRALLVRKRAPIRSRVVRFLESLDFYLSHTQELKELHRILFEKTTFLPCGF